MFDVAVVGLGPAGRALASRCAAHGLSVLAVDPRPGAVWTPTYGIWADELGDLPPDVVRSRVANPELRARGNHPLKRAYFILDNAELQRALPLDGVTVRRARLSDGEVAELQAEAPVVVDARGARPAGTTGADSAPAQTAYGIVVAAEAAAPALDGAEGLLMDWRTDWAGARGVTPPASFLYALPLGDRTVLLEETCLVAAPGMPIAELKARLRRRLVARGVPVEAIDDPLHREIVWIPVRGRDAEPIDGTLAFGTAGRGGNPVTGYSVAHSMRTADGLAQEIARGRPPRTVDPPGAADIPREAGLRALLRLTVDGTLELFDAFGRLPATSQRDFMSRDSAALGLTRAMWGIFARMPAAARMELVRASLGPGRPAR